jgi:8-oxo-dGTP pyrophosphatase MutT (NUDIX family)
LPGADAPGEAGPVERGSPAAVAPRPASTVVLLRPGPRGLEVLLTRRPSTMAFGPGLHVFPGGAVDPADASDLPPGDERAQVAAAIRELAEEVGVVLAGDALVPLSRWVTPPGSSRRYDTRFFAAAMPAGVEIVADPREVADHRWLTPREALAEMAAGRIHLWPPTSTTLRQLLRARGIEEVRRWLEPVGPALAPVVERRSPSVARITFGAAGAIPGQTVDGYLVGRSRLVVVDPGDPSDEATDAISGYAAGLGARVAAILLTAPVPDHAGGAETLAHRLDVPILASAGATAVLSSEVIAIEDADVLGYADVEIRVVATPGTHPDHLAFALPTERVVLVGDLEGPGPSRAIPEPVAGDALRRSRARVVDLGEPLAAHR